MIFADYLLVILLRSCGGDFGRPKCQARSRFAFGGLVTTCFPQEKGYSLKGIWGMFIAFYSIMGEKTLLTYSNARKPAVPNLPRAVQHWQAADTLKLNVDGAYLPQGTRGGVGGVLCDSNGQFRAAFSKPVCHVSSAQHTELLAIKVGLDLVQHMQLQNIIIEMDCLQAVTDITSLAPICLR
ncbi:uncharacterized protein LOC112203841 [Rosa chinensis]|uniref:uncharacterized protein LOC112203841 n=1 Tax=Rosa chinensis TaxID=74649 RepID=UPI000D08B473|nr:uncharacterized protein LOC112203841 [Rosa chinensis]